VKPVAVGAWGVVRHACEKCGKCGASSGQTPPLCVALYFGIRNFRVSVTDKASAWARLIAGHATVPDSRDINRRSSGERLSSQSKIGLALMTGFASGGGVSPIFR
jgi:hypothetical protein